MPDQWLMLNYTLPREPSRLRVGVWRKLKKLGAASLAQSMWVLPDRQGLRAALETLKSEIVTQGGEAMLMSASVDAQSEHDFIARLGAARDEEYTEVLEQCADFMEEMEKETARRNFSFAEIEENETELYKLRQWHATIAARDFFGAGLQAKSAAALEECAAALEVFCEQVYESTEETRRD